MFTAAGDIDGKKFHSFLSPAGMRSLAKEQEEVSRPNTRQEVGRGISHEGAKNNKERTSS